ncbi:hypothetical protein llap_19609 [Limosa lapponica baueri]|uniref:Uncharacterized protein n=1 Tax=Limosa lapponica baueri TaxID=1758121 RepID=A0A2I0T8H0_LIMLA|nr:hypothetical protein llap_19609 [Limosa lapponica baueri]
MRSAAARCWAARGLDNCQEMVNLHCRLLILTAHLKRKCQCKPEDCIDLLDETGALMNLSKVENPASEFASKYLQERKRYILIRVVRKFLGGTPEFRLCSKEGLLWGQGVTHHFD